MCRGRCPLSLVRYPELDLKPQVRLLAFEQKIEA